MDDRFFEAWQRRLAEAADRYVDAKAAVLKSITEQSATTESEYEAVDRALELEIAAFEAYTRLQLAFSKALLENQPPPQEE